MTTLTTRWAPLLGRAIPTVPPAVHTVVVAPHPDDETLMAGGLISLQRRRGVPVTVVAVTDGGAAYPDLPDLDLASIRREEQRQACRRLSVRGPHRLCIPDGGVPAAEADLAALIRPYLVGGGLLVAPWHGDVHSDHEAVGRVCAQLAQTSDMLLWEGLFWTWHQREPDDVADRSVIRLDLDEADLLVRAAAMECHRSQTTDLFADAPILGERALEPMTWPSHHFLLS